MALSWCVKSKERPQVAVKARIVFHKSRKLCPHARMRFEDAAVGLEKEGLGRMEPGKIGVTPGGVRKIDTKHDLRFVQKRAGLFEECGALRLHRSTPSRRISDMSGMRGSL